MNPLPILQGAWSQARRAVASGAEVSRLLWQRDVAASADQRHVQEQAWAAELEKRCGTRAPKELVAGYMTRYIPPTEYVSLQAEFDLKVLKGDLSPNDDDTVAAVMQFFAIVRRRGDEQYFADMDKRIKSLCISN